MVSAKLSGRDYEFQEPILRREQLVRSEELREELQGEPERSNLKNQKITLKPVPTWVDSVHTLTCRTHIFLRTARSLRTLRTFFCVLHTRTAQVHEKGVCCTCVSLISPSRRLPSDDSSVLAVPWRSPRDQSRLRLHWRSHPHDLAVLSRPKSSEHAPLRSCIAKFGYPARSGANTGYEPNEFDKITSVDDDKMLINDPNHNCSNFSKTTKENTRHFDVHTVFESSVSHVSHACNRETVARQRETEEREFVCDQCCKIYVKGKSTEQY